MNHLMQIVVCRNAISGPGEKSVKEVTSFGAFLVYCVLFFFVLDH
jgi:hypothetical protein